jgi:hypothetical protein
LQQVNAAPIIAAPTATSPTLSPFAQELQNYPQVNNYPPDTNFNQSKNKNTVLISVIAALSLVLLLIGFSFISTQSSERAMKQMTVSLTVIDIDMSNCLDMSWGYGDVPGSTVTVSTDIKDVYGTLDQIGEDSFGICEWKTTLMVPENDEQYAVTIGKRRTKFYSNSEVVGNNWKIALSLG